MASQVDPETEMPERLLSAVHEYLTVLERSQFPMVNVSKISQW